MKVNQEKIKMGMTTALQKMKKNNEEARRNKGENDNNAEGNMNSRME